MCVWSVCVCVECVCGGCIRCVFDYVRCSILCSTRYMMKLGVSGIQNTPTRYPLISLLIIIYSVTYPIPSSPQSGLLCARYRRPCEAFEPYSRVKVVFFRGGAHLEIKVVAVGEGVLEVVGAGIVCG